MTPFGTALPYINRNRVDDAEVGCVVFSLSIQTPGGFPKGGTVIGIHTDFDEYGEILRVTLSCLRFWHGGPDIYELDRDDVDPGTMRFETREAGGLATNLFAWLGRRGSKANKNDPIKWGQIAAHLQAIADTGLWTPNAEARYQEHQAAQRTPNPAPMVPEPPSAIKVQQLMEELEASIIEARARRAVLPPPGPCGYGENPDDNCSHPECAELRAGPDDESLEAATDACTNCGGSGWMDGMTAPMECSRCEGSGVEYDGPAPDGIDGAGMLD